MEIDTCFFNRKCFVDGDNAFTDFCNKFTQWKANRGPLYAKIMYAYSKAFNPIENYSSVEQHTGSDTFQNGKKITHTWNDDTITHAYDAEDPLKVTREYDALDPLQQAREYDSEHPLKTATTHENDKEETSYTDRVDTTTSSKAGVNSSTPVAHTIDANAKAGTETTEFKGTRNETTSGKYYDKTTGKYYDTTTGQYTDVHSGSYEDANSGNDVTQYNSTLRKSGNIGVMTPGQMINSDYDSFIIHQDLQRRALLEFLDKYTFYDGEVDIEW